ncbi:MAG: lactate racemase domain-containing protein [Chitinispirillaceae bacterium]|jgi:nickel-dependent lactate racemase
MIFWENSAEKRFLSDDLMRQGIYAALDKFSARKKILIVPPDITRLHSGAGELTRYAYEHDPAAVRAILPALGTHAPMTGQEISLMFGDLPKTLFHAHAWRSDCVTLGEIPADFVEHASGGLVAYSIPVAVNRRIVSPDYDCIFSIGQVVPHEVAGFAGQSKNLFVGLGGAENINKSHFLGATYGMERIMGRVATPVRAVFDYVTDNFLRDIPVIYALTVMDRDSDGAMRPRGLFIGNDRACFDRAAALSCRVNISLLEKPLHRTVVYLDPVEYRSFWLGNKSIYRTRMAMADNSRLIVLAPGVDKFGEDGEIDRLIRTFGYHGTPATLAKINKSKSLRNNLGAAAHLIHGSSEGRFGITYCPGGIAREEVEKAGFDYAPVDTMLKRYNPEKLSEGYNVLPDGEELFFISNPAIGLWAWKGCF